MLKPFDTSKCTPAAIRKLTGQPAEPRVLGTGWIAAINLPSDKPFIVEMENGALFKLGGLSQSQSGQLSAISSQLIGERIAFNFQGHFNDLDQPINARFTTLLLADNIGGIQ